MAPKTSNAQLMCAHQLRPALILDTHGVVTGVNQGILRMIAPSQSSAPQEEHDPLIGRNISQLGLELQPRRRQVLSSWSDLLDAAVHVKGSDDPQDATAANSIHTNTDEFWDEEQVRQAIVESEVCITRRNSGHDAGHDDHSSTVRARVTIHWIESEGSFLLTFERPSLQYRSASDEIASGLFDGIDDPHTSSESSCNAHLEESQQNTMGMSQPGEQSALSNETIPFVTSKLTSTCSTNVLYEMRSPINGTIGMCRRLLDGELSKDQALFAHCISESTSSLLRTMNDVLGISNVGLDSMAIQSPPFPAHSPTKQQYITSGRCAGSASNHPSHEPAIPRTLAPPPQLDVHILLVENNLIMRKIMTKISEKLGHRMTIVDSGQDALTYLARTSGQPRPKVVLLNCKMQVPPLDGYETTRRIRNDYVMFDEETRNLPIIGLAIIGHSDGVEKCLSAGMDDCMTKPVMQKKFKDMLVKWMVARRSYKLGHVVDAKL